MEDKFSAFGKETLAKLIAFLEVRVLVELLGRSDSELSFMCAIFRKK